MHLPLLSRIILLMFQFFLLTMALPAGRPQGPAHPAPVDKPHGAGVHNRDLLEDKPDSEENKRAVPFGRSINVDKPSTPVKAAVRSPDREIHARQPAEDRPHGHS